MNCALAGVGHTADFAPRVALRRPVALALSADETRLLVANRDSGSVSIIDAGELKLLSEVEIGERLSDIVRLDATHFLVTDEAAHEILLLRLADDQLKVVARARVSQFPLNVVAAADGSRAYVASLWSRRVSVVEVQPDHTEPLRIAAAIDLPIAPNKQLLVKGESSLVVADHFAGRLGIVSLTGETPELVTVRSFFAENIRGLGVDPKSGLLAVAHTMLNEYAHTIRNDVHWGVLMSNDLRWLRLDEVLDPQGDFYNKGHMHPLGEPNMGGSDPGELAFFDDGTVIVTMSGVGKVAFGKEGDFGLHRYDVGLCPTAVVASNRLRRAYVANLLGDSVSVVDIEKKEVVAEILLGPQRELTLAERGEVLFRSGKLSHDGWMTCQSCHTDGHTTGGLNDNFSDKSFGAPKRVLSLLNARETAPYAWNGSSERLEDQIRRSVEVTMQGPKLSDDQVAALSAYLQTFTPPAPVEKLRGTEQTRNIAQGEQLFKKLDCATCHAPPTYTTADIYDVGLHDKEGNTHFNPPSLRGVGQRDPLFHDASAPSLEEVFRKYGHQLNGRKLTDEELRDLTAFLRSL
jgi:YVTN family beta-propeller protein